MDSNRAGDVKVARKMVFHRVAGNLYRLEQSGGYYALLKRADKQFRRSLKTKDRKMAERRLSALREQVGKLTTSGDGRLTFEQVAQRRKDATGHTVKASTVKRWDSCIKNLGPFFAGVPIRNIQARHCERWLTERAAKIAPQTMANELNVLRPIFAYAVRGGLMLSNPAADIRRHKFVQKPITVPSRDQFRSLLATIRQSDGRTDSQAKAKPGADLVELLAYTGCRIAEAGTLTWADVDFDHGTLTVTGGERGTKNHESRTIPMTDALRVLLLRLRDERTPQPSDRISSTNKAKTCSGTACRTLS